MRSTRRIEPQQGRSGIIGQATTNCPLPTLPGDRLGDPIGRTVRQLYTGRTTDSSTNFKPGFGAGPVRSVPNHLLRGVVRDESCEQFVFLFFAGKNALTDPEEVYRAKEKIAEPIIGSHPVGNSPWMEENTLKIFTLTPDKIFLGLSLIFGNFAVSPTRRGISHAILSLHFRLSATTYPGRLGEIPTPVWCNHQP